MADDFYDEGFHVLYPSWLLVHKSSVTRAADGSARFVEPVKWLTMPNDKGEQSVPVFTDEHTALSYCEASGLLDEAEMIAAEDSQHLAQMLRLLSGMGLATSIVFDPKKPIGASAHVWPIDYVAERIERGQGL